MRGDIKALELNNLIRNWYYKRVSIKPDSHFVVGLISATVSARVFCVFGVVGGYTRFYKEPLYKGPTCKRPKYLKNLYYSKRNT